MSLLWVVRCPLGDSEKMTESVFRGWNSGFFTKEVAVICEDAIEQKPAMKKRILVASLLALAAVGTHWLPGRTIVATQPEPQQCFAAVAADKMVTGPNNLLGDIVLDKTAQTLATNTDLSQYHLEMDDVIDQGGSIRILSEVAPVSSGLANTGEIQSIGQVSAVPEPRTAGLFLLAAAPALIRRKGRDTVAA
jgi:hypothetical protein